MKKSFSPITISLICFLTVFFCTTKQVLADGMVIGHDPYSDRWDYSNEKNQQAFINLENGTEKMIISIGLESKESKGSVWLFPVPADPSKVAVDVVKSLPDLTGEELSGKAKTNLDDAARLLQISQLYTIPFMSENSSNLVSAGIDGSTSFSAELGTSKSSESDVVVYGHLDKEGITSEIITAKTANGLYDYLTNKGLKVENGAISILDNYIGQAYSFVVSWLDPQGTVITADELISSYDQYYYPYYKFLYLISNLKQKYPDFQKADNQTEYLKSSQGAAVLQEIVQAIQDDPTIIQKDAPQKGVYVTFPTKEMYFPLMPTSVYDTKTVPASIRIIGHVTPKIFSDIKGYTKTKYYVDEFPYFSDDQAKFYNGPTTNVKYTKIEINVPSKFLTEDLWISSRTPLKVYYSGFIARNKMVTNIILLILSSAIAGILAGLIYFVDLRKKPLKLGLIGLSNALTIIGLVVTIAVVSTKNQDEKVSSLINGLKQKGYFWRRKFAAISFILAALTFTFGLLVWILAISSDTLSSIVGIVFVVGVLFLVLGFIFRNIKSEDKALFDKLQAAGYSTWSLQPKDPLKVAFVPTFSAFFLVISLLLIKLVELTV